MSRGGDRSPYVARHVAADFGRQRLARPRRDMGRGGDSVASRRPPRGCRLWEAEARATESEHVARWGFGLLTSPATWLPTLGGRGSRDRVGTCRAVGIRSPHV